MFITKVLINLFTSIMVICISLTAIAWDKWDFPGVPQQDEGKLKKVMPSKAYSPYANRNFPSRPLFGDTHLHTSFSMDAGVSGARLFLADAYRFAKGEQLTSSTGQPVKLSRSLDFLFSYNLEMRISQRT